MHVLVESETRGRRDHRVNRRLCGLTTNGAEALRDLYSWNSERMDVSTLLHDRGSYMDQQEDWSMKTWVFMCGLDTGLNEFRLKDRMGRPRA